MVAGDVEGCFFNFVSYQNDIVWKWLLSQRHMLYTAMDSREESA